MSSEDSDDAEADIETPAAGDEDFADLPEEPDQEEAKIYMPSRSALGERRAPRQLWLISYADFMTILMIFFLAMYGYTYLAKAALLKKHSQEFSESKFSGRIDEMKEKLGKQLTIQNDVDKVVLQLEEKILFASGKAALRAEAFQTLEELSNSIKLIDGDVIVSGHTDDIPVAGGRFKSNWELSAARAFSVIEALAKAGLPPQRLAAWGFGENRPVVPNISEENRAQNRRIEIVILKKKQKA